MRTKFGKSLIATGLIAALGANMAATSPAFAGPGRDRDGGNDRGFSRDNGRNDGRDRGRDNRHGNKARTDNRQDDRRGHQVQRAAPAPQQAPRAQARHDGGPSRGRPDNRTVQWRAPAAESHRAPVKVMQKPRVVQNTVVVKQPPVVHRNVVNQTVVNKTVVHAAPPVKVGYDYSRGYDRDRGYNHHSPHGHYGPPPTRVIVVPERRRYRDVWVVRHYGHRYHGYGHYVRDDDAYKWLAFTAISVALINNLTINQQRAYEDAQIRATAAPIGETIQWQDAGAYGTVTATRDGTSSNNRYCREFQKTVTIGGQTEQAYGTACMQPDGAWEVVSDNNY